MSYQNVGPFLPIAFVLPDDPKVRQQYVEKRETDTALYLNQREIGSYYVSSEYVNGQQWKVDSNPSVQAFRKVINFGALPNATTKSVAHGITFNINSVVTRLYAVATHPAPAPPTPYDPAQQLFLPLPYSDPTNLLNCIALNADGTNINITTGSNRTAYTVCYVVIEYLKG